METAAFGVAGVLAFGGVVAATVTSRPRPKTMREVIYLAIPVVSVIVLIWATWTTL